MKLKNKNYKKIAVISLVGISVVASIGVWYWKNNDQKNNEVNVSETESPAPQESINLSPPTEEEKQESDQKKQEIVKDQQQVPSPTNSNVTPVISNAGVYDGQVEVSSFVPGIIETDGKYTAKFTNGRNTVTKEVIAINDATTTRCTNFVIPSSEFNPKGSWAVVVSYSSAKFQGSSEPKALEVQ